MPPKPKTRHSSGGKYGGTSHELPTADLPTYRQVIQGCYFEKELNPQKTPREISQIINDKLVERWAKANPRIVLLFEESIRQKVERVYTSATKISQKHEKKSVKKTLDGKLDKLFDLAACVCDLPEASCLEINCKKLKC